MDCNKFYEGNKKHVKHSNWEKPLNIGWSERKPV